MNRYNNIFEALGPTDKPKTIELSSELVTGQAYSIDGNGPYTYLGRHDGAHKFKGSSTNETIAIANDDLENSISHGDIKSYVDRDSHLQQTIPDYPHLDIFTARTFSYPTNKLWDLHSLRDKLSSSELMDLDGLIADTNIKEMPLPNEQGYDKLVENPKWKLLKKYLHAMYPELDLPENLG